MNLCNNQFESLQVRSSRCAASFIGRDRPPGCPSEKGRDRPLGCPSEKGRDRPLGCPRTAQPTVPTSAFSLIEIMVVVALLAFIIIGLVAMFNQTRQAFVSSMTQVDVMESGRIATDMIGRDVEQLASTSPSGLSTIWNFYVATNANYPSTLMMQPLLDPNDFQINNILQFYFVTRNNQQWSSIGYRLSGADYANGIGTLYRFTTNNISYTDTVALLNLPAVFLNNDPNSGSGYWSKLIDGVVDFRVRVFDMKGDQITNYFSNLNPPPITVVSVTNTFTTPVGGTITNVDYLSANFQGDALPASVEIELGVLEDRALAHYRALTNLPAPTAWSYLTNHAAQVHIFRQRVPIRDVNPTFYP